MLLQRPRRKVRSTTHAQCYGIGPASDFEDGAKGYGAHSDQERILEAELHRATQTFARSRKDLEVVEKSLQGAALWDEVKDRLKASALGLSGGQQQRLCIARAIAVGPEVLLMDEPCSALDPIATGKIEDLIAELRGAYTILMVTHNMQQAARSSDYTAFMYLGRLLEYGSTEMIFQNPHLQETQDYVTGRFG